MPRRAKEGRKRPRSDLGLALLLAACCAASGAVVPAAAAETPGPRFSARPRWSPAPGAIGYRVYFRNGATGWDAGHDVGPGVPDGDGGVFAVVADLPLGNRNIFAVTSYDVQGRESARSNELGLARSEVVAVASTPTPTPGSLSTPQPTPDPAPTPTPVVEATPTPSPSSAPTATPGPTPEPTPEPTPGPTPEPTPEPCGNGRVDEGESCDISADAACPGMCDLDCSCLDSFDLPLRGWTRAEGDGTWSVSRILDDDGTTLVRVLQTDTGLVPAKNFGIAYPATVSLGKGAPVLSLLLQSTENYSVRVVVHDSEGSVHRLVYSIGGFLPYAEGRTVNFPLDRATRGPDFVEVRRDLAADLRVATGKTVATVEQAAVFGRMSVKRIRLERAEDPEIAPEPGDTLALPAQGWAWNLVGDVAQGIADPDFDGPVARADRTTSDAELPRLGYPAESSRKLVAPFGRITAEVGRRSSFALEAMLVLGDRTNFRLTYSSDVTEAVRTSKRTATLPLPLANPGDTWNAQFLVADLVADLALFRPTATLAGITRVRLFGGFRIGPILLDRRLAP